VKVFHNPRVFSIFVVVLFAFLSLTAFLVAYQQRDLLRSSTHRRALYDLDLMADASVEALLKSDYVTVRTFVERWGLSHADIRLLRVVTPNGFVLAEHLSASPFPGETYALSKEVKIADKTVATISLVGDYREAEKIAAELGLRLLLASLIITTLLGAALWVTMRKLAVAPLEKMVEERTRDLSAAVQDLAQEINERIKTAETLKQREEHISLLLNSIAEGVYGVDLEGRCTFCNPAALKMLGYASAQEVIGRNLHQLIHHSTPDGRSIVEEECTLYRCGKEGKTVHSESEVFWRADGTSFPVEYWAQPVVSDGVLVGVVTAFVDISERKRAEESLREQEQELSAIFDNAPYLMILYDEERGIVRKNSVPFLADAAPGADVVGGRIGAAFNCINAVNQPGGCGAGPLCRDCVIRDAITDTLKTGRNHYQREAQLRVASPGHDKVLTLLISTARLSIRKRPMVLCSINDISENRRLEGQLRQAQKMESIGTLAGGVAHDFNNILTAIIGYGQLTLLKMQPDDPHRVNLQHILDSADRASHLTKDLLLFSRKQPIDRKLIDLNEGIQKLGKFLTRVIGEDIALKITLSGGVMPVRADSYQIDQILMNLATNARDSMPQGGSFTIGTARVNLDEAAAAANGLVRPGNYAQISISDTGVGMDEPTRQRIFEPFFTTKEVGKGTGLGLSVVYGIVKQHEGTVNVYSEPGQGTTFRIYLPLAESKESEQVVAVAEEAPTGGTETILLAEDDQTVRDITVMTLENFGYQVITAVDGAEAVAKFKENRERLQLLLFDLIMPRKSGKEAYDEIRLLQPDIKIIFASGYDPDMLRQRALLELNVPMLYKPVPMALLLKTVRDVLDGNGAKK
jgi:two-component system NtrC family sensor kinase